MITKKVFTDLAIYMIGFGVLIGIIFPFFITIIGVPSSYVYTPMFFFLCIGAGCVVGLVNISLSRSIVGKKLKNLSFHMKYIENRLKERKSHPEIDDCTDENCFIAIDSEDEIGESARAFNALVTSLSMAIKSETSVRVFTEMLSSHLELDKLASDALKNLMENTLCEAGLILVEKDGDLHVLASVGIKDPISITTNDLVWKVIKDHKRSIFNLPDSIVLDALLVEFRPKAILIEPILYKESLLGIVVLASTQAFAMETQDSMELFSNGLALAFRNAITYDQLQRLAANDPLTGVLNRRFGMTRFKEEFSRAIRSNLPIGVIFFDIDHFKTINDIYGHPVGDKVLINLTQTAKQSLREGDILLRYGGEEFLIILPGASMSDVFQISERLRHLVEDSEVRHFSQTIKITVSLGGTSYPEHDVADIVKMIEVADNNLYQAKHTGRNKSIIGFNHA